MTKIKGEATAGATEKWAEKLSDKRGWQFSLLGKTGFKVSKAGFGCYRISIDNEVHYNALYKSLKEGINLIDTSTNYALGASEELVGKVMGDMIEEGTIKREDIVIVSKIGYIQGPAMKVAIEREEEGKPFPEIVYYNDNCWHSIHPEFLEDQLQRSLKRLNLEKLDVLLLHNPEYFLSLAHKKGKDREKSHKEYYSRIEKAFAYLEEQVKNNRIGWYGISSNTFPSPAEKFDHTSLEKVWNIASNISTDHHFAVIQLPGNLYEDGPVFNKNQKEKTVSVLDFAKEKNLGVLINRPLNSYPEGRFIRLSDFPVKEKADKNMVKERLKELISKESNLTESLPPLFKGSLNTGKILKDQWKLISGIDHWNMIRYNYLIPDTNRTVRAIKHNGTAEITDNALNSYVDELNLTMDIITDYYYTKSQEQSDDIHEKLNKFIPENIKPASLSQKAVWMLYSLSAISSVLVGMREERYVDDVSEGLKYPASSEAKKLWERWKEVKED